MDQILCRTCGKEISKEQIRIAEKQNRVAKYCSTTCWGKRPRLHAYDLEGKDFVQGCIPQTNLNREDIETCLSCGVTVTVTTKVHYVGTVGTVITVDVVPVNEGISAAIVKKLLVKKPSGEEPVILLAVLSHLWQRAFVSYTMT